MPSEEPSARFVCPKCGASKFGSRLLEDGAMHRHCHGESGCRFSFHQDDDWMHFELEGRPFASPEEHEAHMERWRAETYVAYAPEEAGD